MKESIIVSACLTGLNCRYNNTSARLDGLDSLKDKYNIIPVCPELLGGLSTPRKSVELINGKATDCNGADYTRQFLKGADKVLEIANKNKCRYAILKSNSPSCGSKTIYDGTFSGKIITGKGICAQILQQAGVSVFDETDFNKINQ